MSSLSSATVNNGNNTNGKKHASQKEDDERNVRTLRELANSVPSNRNCFDCQQRGPTSVNVTVGSFVCTSCSGILRGLNPPHRIKSITMASFTADEMEQIKSKGNEYCKQVWLGKYDSPQSLELEYQNIQKIKDFMIRKYEDKKYYVDPEVAMKKPKARAPAVPVNTVHTSRSQVTLMETRTPDPITKKPTWSTQDFPCSERSSTDTNLFNDAKVDPFRQSTSHEDSSVENSSFADFGSAFGKSTSTSSQFGSNTDITLSSTSIMPVTTALTSSPAAGIITKPSQKKPAPPPPDRYAALADLDNELNQQQQHTLKTSAAVPVTKMPSIGVASNTIPYGAVNYHAVVPNPFGSHSMVPWVQPNMMVANPSSNPFQPASNALSIDMPNASNGMLNGNVSANQQQLQNGTVAVRNNFWSNGKMANPSPWSSTDPFQGKDDPFRSKDDPFTMKNAISIDKFNPWAQTISNESANPFAKIDKVTNVPQKSSHTNNPFL